MKNIWIFQHYASPPNKGGLVRAYDFAKQLIKKGYKVKIFSSAFNHFTHENIETKGKLYKRETEDGVPFVWVKTSEYKGNGTDRVKNMLSFYVRLPKVVKEIIKYDNEKPDVIIASSAHPLTCVAGIKIAKKLKVPCIVEIRDLWPESIVEYSSKLTKKNPVIKLLYKLEKWIYKKADKIIFTMEGGKDYIIDQGWDKEINLDKVYHINNGVDLEKFDYNKEHYQVKDDDLDDEQSIKVVYTGSIRRVNNIGLILDAAKEIENPKVKFLIWGDGNEVDSLKERIFDEDITNVIFKGRVEKKYVPYILSKADINLCHNTESKLFRYGISFNKLFDYYSSGKPVLIDFKTGFNPIEKNKCGISCETDELNRGLEKFIAKGEHEIIVMGENARRVAEEHDFRELTKKLIQVIEGV